MVGISPFIAVNIQVRDMCDLVLAVEVPEMRPRAITLLREIPVHPKCLLLMSLNKSLAAHITFIPFPFFMMGD